MICDKSIAVVVPAYNEQRLLPLTLASIPDFVDRVVVVDDCSTDALVDPSALGDPRVTVVRHDENRGVGASIVTGYRWCLDNGLDVAAVMAADNQMHPDDLEPLVRAVLAGEGDYVCGDRLAWPEGWRAFPKVRLVGVIVLARLTRWVTGLSFLRDAQCGFTAFRVEALRRLDLDSLYPRYGFPNDLLAKSALAGLTVATRPVRPVYADEKSKLSVPRVVLPILRLSLANWWLRRRLRRHLLQAPTSAPVSESAREQRVDERWARGPAA